MAADAEVTVTVTVSRWRMWLVRRLVSLVEWLIRTGVRAEVTK